MGFLVRLTVTAAIAALVPLSSAQVRLVSWNVNKGRKVEALAQALARFGPDICLLQEVDQGVRRSGGLDITAEVAVRLGIPHHDFAPSFEELSGSIDGRPAFVGQGLISRYPLRARRVLNFQTQSGFWKPNRLLPNWGILQRRRGGRVAQIVELDTPAGPLAIYNVHLESRTWGKIRRAQLHEMLADAQRHYSAGAMTVIFAGDFNSQFDPSALLERMRAAGFRNSYGDTRRRTHRLAGSVDWIFVRGPVHLRNGEVHRGIGVSDHFPLSVQLLAPPPSAP